MTTDEVAKLRDELDKKSNDVSTLQCQATELRETLDAAHQVFGAESDKFQAENAKLKEDVRELIEILGIFTSSKLIPILAKYLAKLQDQVVMEGEPGHETTWRQEAETCYEEIKKLKEDVAELVEVLKVADDYINGDGGCCDKVNEALAKYKGVKLEEIAEAKQGKVDAIMRAVAKLLVDVDCRTFDHQRILRGFRKKLRRIL